MIEATFEAEHQKSLEAIVNEAKRPKGLYGLLRWYEKQWRAEVPDKLHVHAVWNERGFGSELGTYAYTDPFRRYLFNSPNEIDDNGYFMRPIHSALWRLERKKPLMARTLFALAQGGFDWRKLADAGKWPHEMFEIYIEGALQFMWREYAERTFRTD